MFISSRSRIEHWEQLLPASGRPLCLSMSSPESWGVTKGHADLLQHNKATSSQEMKHVLDMQKKAKSSAWAKTPKKKKHSTPCVKQPIEVY